MSKTSAGSSLEHMKDALIYFCVRHSPFISMTLLYCSCHNRATAFVDKQKFMQLYKSQACRLE